MNNYEEDVLYNSIEHYGRDYIHFVCMEECGELIQAISKKVRYEYENKSNDAKYFNSLQNLEEEIADVEICINYLKLLHDIDEQDIEEWKEKKLKRIEGRTK